MSNGYSTLERNKKPRQSDRTEEQFRKKQTCSTLISIAGKRLRSLLTKSPSSPFFTVLTLCVSSTRDERLDDKQLKGNSCS